MTLVIGATVERGFGVTNKNLKFQMPHLIWQFPELKSIYTLQSTYYSDSALHVSSYDRLRCPFRGRT